MSDGSRSPPPSWTNPYPGRRPPRMGGAQRRRGEGRARRANGHNHPLQLKIWIYHLAAGPSPFVFRCCSPWRLASLRPGPLLPLRYALALPNALLDPPVAPAELRARASYLCKFQPEVYFRHGVERFRALFYTARGTG